jgi:hypothetical protein
MFGYERVKFDYEPYPLGLISDVFEPAFYNELTRTYPSLDLFKSMASVGNKYALSERNAPAIYHRFLEQNEAWGRFHAYVKGKEFIERTLEMLKSNYVDLNLGKYRVVPNTRWKHANPLNTVRGISELTARFEFSMMSGKGGNIRPHTDHPLKLITLVFSAMPAGEWNQAWGGSTAVVWPKDRRRIYNQANKYLNFDEVDIVKEFPFNPNQALIFVKTFNSWHAVAPMTAPDDTALRKTLTINIEKRKA